MDRRKKKKKKKQDLDLDLDRELRSQILSRKKDPGQW